MANGKRAWTGAETRLLGEWLAQRHPGRITAQRVRLGRVPDELTQDGLSDSEVRALSAWKRWADALVILEGTVLLVEAAIIASPGKLGQLEVYLALWPETEERAPYHTWPVRGHLLCAVGDPVVERIAIGKGFTYEVFCPAWVTNYLAEMAPHRRRAPL